ncbi:alpha/beta fold hydrolase [Pseudomonas nitroreducens]|uniref:alpha/beta fold hydrolase n=1 Tax=Pseudomonas nitroreducens TaxID=46680 RepID=UPI001E50F2A5|nr:MULTISPECIES: alpha/beta hydrolase [Pseudomonas]MCE4071398.1 alpha/beta hydrolase [Pseudomonas nitritireducens]MCE4080719.1 alpha/beta hydrolase [Pseudomonas nitroreducens]
MRLLLLPGLNGSTRLFTPLLSHLPADLIVECLELPEEGAQDYPSLADALQPKLGNTPFVLLGESFSGPLARMIAQRSPAGLRGVVFAATFAERPSPLLSLLQFLPLPPAALLAQRRLIRHFCVGRNASEALVNLIADEVRRLPAARTQARLKVLAQLRKPTSPLRTPCLSLVPLNDQLVSRRARTSVAVGCENIKTKAIAGPHFLLQSRPEPCAAAIAAFLNELS